MKSSNLMAAIVAAAMTSSCTGGQNAGPAQPETKKIEYNIGKNYFVRTDIPEDSLPLFITTAEDRDSLLGMAATMGKDGQPTQIDFENETILNLALPTTDCPTEIEVKDVYMKSDTLYVEYTANVGPKSSFSMKPYKMVIIKNEDIVRSKDIIAVEVE